MIAPSHGGIGRLNEPRILPALNVHAEVALLSACMPVQTVNEHHPEL
jgi:hypothetical protein